MDNANRKSIGVMEILIIAGFAAFFCWFLLVMVGMPKYFPQGATAVQHRAIQLAGFASLVAGYAFAIKTPFTYNESAYSVAKIVIWTAVALVIPAASLIEFAGMGMGVILMAVLYVAAGLAAGYFYIGWENLTARGRVRDLLLCTGLGMVLGCLLFLVVSLVMTQLAAGVMCVIFILMSSALFYYVSTKRYPKREDEGEDKKRIDEKTATELLRSKFNNKLSTLLLIENLPLGMALAMVYSVSQSGFYLAVCLSTAMLVIYVALNRFTSKLRFTALLRISIGISGVALLVMSIDEKAVTVGVLLLIATWLTMKLAHNGSLLNLTNVQDVEPVYLIVRGKLPGEAGFLLGFLVGIVMVAHGSSPDIVRLIALAMVAVLLVSVVTLLPVSEHYTGQLAAREEEPKPNLEGLSSDESERQRCAQLAKRFNLSPREEEVLFYIVKGRNAKFVSEKLVISESTAKTHIHNIYKKSGVHSQQKFIDLMDELL